MSQGFEAEVERGKPAFPFFLLYEVNVLGAMEVGGGEYTTPLFARNMDNFNKKMLLIATNGLNNSASQIYDHEFFRLFVIISENLI